VTIFYKDTVFDPQGNTVAEGLRRLGFKTVKNARVGKVVDIELDSKNATDAKLSVDKMCEKLLANPVIESFKTEIIGGSGA
jgi:phosphoribosylformylglycinamidine synthase